MDTDELTNDWPSSDQNQGFPITEISRMKHLYKQYVPTVYHCPVYLDNYSFSILRAENTIWKIKNLNLLI